MYEFTYINVYINVCMYIKTLLILDKNICMTIQILMYIYMLKLIHESQVWLIIRYLYYKTAGYLRTQRN